MAVLNNAQCFVASAPGTGTVTLGNSPAGWAHWANIGAVSGQRYSYRIDDGTDWEIGIGTYTATVNGGSTTYTVTRGPLFSSTGSTLNASANAVITQTASAADFLAPSRNRIINGNFSINQRSNPAASTSYAAGVYILDRWKAGANGVTMSFSAGSNGDTVVTITAGSLLQIVEGKLYAPEGGPYTLSWQGTAAGRVYMSGSSAPAYTASPYINTSVTVGGNVVCEFSTGTVSLAQLEPGSTYTAFERISPSLDLLRAQRYFFAGAMRGCVGGNNGSGSFAGNYISGHVVLPVPMGFAPNLIFFDYVGNQSSVSCGNGNGNTLASGGLSQKYFQCIYMDALMNSAGLTYWWACLFQASAEL